MTTKGKTHNRLTTDQDVPQTYKELYMYKQKLKKVPFQSPNNDNINNINNNNYYNTNDNNDNNDNNNNNK